ncbi:class I SAM-dependent methyltransferase, partial [Candidatus Latescibacterota bacterium]
MNECVVCRSTINEFLYEGIRKCTNCGHVFSDMQLSDEELFELYKKQYFFGDEYKDYPAEKEILQKNFRLRLKELQPHIDSKRHKHMLELGCAYGFFMDVARDSFETVAGIDITEDGVSYARDTLKLNVVCDDFLKHDFGDQSFDVACMWDTIEHLRHPDRYVAKLGTHMKSGALLALTTGDIDSFVARFKKDTWRLIHPPTHIHYFSIKTMTEMLDKHGFDVIHDSHCGFYRSISTVTYTLFVLQRGWTRLYNLLASSGLTGLD